jgi:RNA polymerase sigma-70 factor (family 1)
LPISCFDQSVKLLYPSSLLGINLNKATFAYHFWRMTPLDTIEHFVIDELIFTDLYNQYWERMYAICYQHSSDAEQSREMVQDIFRSLWEKRADLKIQTSIEHYLMKAARLKACEHIRNKVSRDEHQNHLQQIAEVQSDHTEQQILYRDLAGQVSVLVDGLSLQCRTVYRMNLDEDISNKEIADRLSLSEKTVSYHLVKARAILKARLAAIFQLPSSVA